MRPLHLTVSVAPGASAAARQVPGTQLLTTTDAGMPHYHCSRARVWCINVPGHMGSMTGTRSPILSPSGAENSHDTMWRQIFLVAHLCGMSLALRTTRNFLEDDGT